MATTTSIVICPDCRSPLPEQIPHFCPNCGTDSAYIRKLRRERQDTGFEPVRPISKQLMAKMEAVSYTHLTLPTIYSV